ncbi:MAG TPA: YdjY domain-containing protein [Gemmataceae bacterium]|nr:YdjY domain-containing protein [Gemmataceae bacterium]
MSTLLSNISSQDQPQPGPHTPKRRGLWTACSCGALALLPGVGLVLGPVALGLGVRDLQATRRQPGSSAGPAVAAIVLGVLGLLVQVAAVALLLWLADVNLFGVTSLSSGDRTPPSTPDSKPATKPAESKRVKMGENVFLEIQGEQRRVLVHAVVCMREGQLEQFLTRKMTKEHEAILAADVDARTIHAALNVAGAKEGSPVKYQPRYQPATGSRIKVTVQYEDQGKLITVPAQQWVRYARTGKNLDIDWVFAGSKLVDVPFEPGRKYYLANDGDIICVSNFDTAMLDLPIRSPKDNADLAFEAHTERIPPLGTKVTVILEVLPEKN